MKYSRYLFVLLAISLMSLTAAAQKPWERPMDDWSKEDALHILNDSPFAKSYTSPNSVADAEKANVGREMGNSVLSGGSNPRSTGRTAAAPPVTARLHSAKIVRQAIVSLKKLTPEYENLGSTERKTFDDQQTAYIDNKIYDSYYVISVTKTPDSTPGQVDEGIFQRTTLADVKGNVWLVADSGEKLEVFQFTPPKGGGGSAYFFFKRFNDAGEPFLKPNMKSFRLVFSNDFLTSKNPYTPFLPRNFEFTLSKITIDGKVMF